MRRTRYAYPQHSNAAMGLKAKDMNIQECKIDQIVYFPFGDTKRLGIVVGFGKNPVDEDVPLVQWKNNKGVYSEPCLCHPKNIHAL